MLFPIITFITAITIAAIAAWFSVAGLMAIFTASAISVAIMAVALEVGKLVAASWVYRNWKRAPFLLKSYLTVAVIVLMLITSMGIFGFLSKAHLEQAADSEENTARIERVVQDMARYESTNTRLELKITKLDNEGETDTSKVQGQIDQEETRMDNVMVRIQPSIDEQNLIITTELSKDDSKVAPYLSQMDNLDADLIKLENQAKKYENDITSVGNDTTSYDYAVAPFQDQIAKIKSDIVTFKEMSKSGTNADLKKAQAVVGIPWGYWRNAEVLKEWNEANALKLTELGTKIAEVRKDFENQYKAERIRLSNMVVKLRGQDSQKINDSKMDLLVKIETARGMESPVISSARVEIKRLREKADREVAGSLIILDRLRNELLNVSQVDNSTEIDTLQLAINSNDDAIDELIDQKFELEREIRAIATEIGPIKYIAEMVYDNTDNDTIDQAVRWLIIVFIFVFDPLAVLLLIAANYSFQNRNNGGRQEEIFDKVSFKKKKGKKPLDISPKISDNIIKEEVIDIALPEEVVEEQEEPEDDNFGVILDDAEIDEDIEEELTPEEVVEVKKKIEREINTKAIRKDGWLDDVDTNTK